MEINGRQAFAILGADGKQSGSLVTFWETTAKNEFISKIDGRPIFDTVLMGEIRNPGDKMTIFSFEIERRIAASQVDPVKYPGSIKYRVDNRSERWRDVLGLQLEAWEKKREAQDMSGTPLESWPRLDVATIASLRASGVYSIEALASVTDNNLGSLGLNGRTLREQAKNFLEAARGSAPIERLTAENESLKASVDMLKDQLKALSDRFDTGETENTGAVGASPRRGRPPKAQAA